MTAGCLFLCVFLGQAPDVDPARVVNQLGASRFMEREQAAALLEQLGRAALPALRSAHDLKDAEIRTRAAALIVKIEAGLLTKPSMVRMDYQGAALPDVVRSLSEQTGMKVELVPERSPAWTARPITLREPAPVPFWTAVDRLCDAANLQYNYGVHYAGGRGPSFPLFEGAGRPEPPISDSGPFRVSVVGIHYQRDVNFLVPAQASRGGKAGRPIPTRSEQFYAQLQVTAEPRLALTQLGNVRITEALDDHGKRLFTPSAAENATAQRVSGYFGYSNGPVVQLQALLNRPSEPATTLKRFKGVIPLAASTRKANPLVIPLAGSTGRAFRNDEIAITVLAHTMPENNRPGTIELALRSLGANHPDPGTGPADLNVRPDTYQQQIEVVDGLGRLVPWYQTGFDAEAGRLTMTIPNDEPGAKTVELRFFGLIRASADVPFEFTDLPLR
jgi:hypothetical protein